MTAITSGDKLSAVCSFVSLILSRTHTSVKDLAKTAGHLAAFKPAFGNFVLLCSRSAYAIIADHTDRFGWSGSLPLTDSVRPSLNCHPHRQDHAQCAVQDLLPSSIVVAGDASTVGVCAYSIQSPSRFFFQDIFSSVEASLSSGHRELLTVIKALRSVFILKGSTLVR